MFESVISEYLSLARKNLRGSIQKTFGKGLRPIRESRSPLCKVSRQPMSHSRETERENEEVKRALQTAPKHTSFSLIFKDSAD